MTNTSFYKSSSLVKIFYIFILIILWIISGWNTKNGDLDNYELMYSYDFSADFFENLDVGFMYILSIFKGLGFSFQQFHVYIYFIYFLFVGWFIYKSSKKPVAAILVYILLFFFRDCITLRNSLSVIFLLLALYAYTRKGLKHKKIYFIVAILIASTIHVSFLAYLILLCSNNKINYKWLLCTSLGLAFVADTILSSVISLNLFSNNADFQNKYNDYLLGSSWFTPIMATATLLMNYNLTKKSLSLKGYGAASYSDYVIKSLLNISTILFVIVIFSSISMVAMRYFYNYFMFAYIFIFNRLYCEELPKSNKLTNTRICFWGTVAWVFLWLVYMSGVSMNIPIILNNNSF